MAKDKRLFMTFPNDFWMHPKVAPLSIDAKWSFVEMNGYSRMQDLDGAIPAVMAERLWKIEVLEELVTSHPERPLVVLTDGLYVIRDYDKHQQTTTDREALSEVRAEAGRRGRARQLADKPRANAGQVPGQIRAETETETETLKKKDLVQQKVEHTHDFEMFWELYPRKQGKSDALKAYTAVRKKVDAKTIHAGAQAYALLNIGEDKSFLKMPGGWLRGERWADEQIVNSTRQTVTGSNERFCDRHPDYPVSARYPCEACSRSVGLPDGRDF